MNVLAYACGEDIVKILKHILSNGAFRITYHDEAPAVAQREKRVVITPHYTHIPVLLIKKACVQLDIPFKQVKNRLDKVVGFLGEKSHVWVGVNTYGVYSLHTSVLLELFEELRINYEVTSEEGSSIFENVESYALKFLTRAINSFSK